MEWTAAKLYLPSAGEQVIAWSDTYGVQIAKYKNKKWLEWGLDCLGGMAWIELPRVTHWMPLPLPPED